MLRKFSILLIIFIAITSIIGCSNSETTNQQVDERLKIGIMLSDVGLGDQSFSDAGFEGLERARDELDISFDYREISESQTYEAGLEELVEQGNEIVIGLGFAMQEAVDVVAKKYPEQTFLIIDSVSELPNVHSITFKEEEGSFLIGVLAGLKTQSNVVGFVGGMDVPLIRKFEKGFIEGVKTVNAEATVISEFAGSFGDDKLGAEIARNMITNQADFIYPAAGFTGVGVLQETQKSGVYSFGVDSDQYFLAERSVVSSMLKNIDVAVYNVAKELVENKKLEQKDISLGIKEDGVGLAPIRVLTLTESEEQLLNQLSDDIKNGKIKIQP
ncbi:BMP family ABC transporter substrate-binding protein [Bacillus luteolus]|uniref:BMP family ABC transporter substrate-binding protein n=1 Tax=Litchfieldia luteola TaxID=682179 RepID=A0ABR9QD56_9BACI|nr:BMP family ABC transporter substrate-binding protein [Cytobacillus luteolus]MBE4906442.1 BMP family ABC transporter substrate-binding protein [Cytobacillus luteolus]